MLVTLVSFAIIVGVLIFVHELGHFVAAKSLGIQVHRFSLGFGKPIVKFVDPLADWTVWSGDAFYLQPTFWDNTLARGSQPRTVSSDCAFSSSPGVTQPRRACHRRFCALKQSRAPEGSPSAASRRRRGGTRTLPRRRLRLRPKSGGG